MNLSNKLMTLCSFDEGNCIFPENTKSCGSYSSNDHKEPTAVSLSSKTINNVTDRVTAQRNEEVIRAPGTSEKLSVRKSKTVPKVQRDTAQTSNVKKGECEASSHKEEITSAPRTETDHQQGEPEMHPTEKLSEGDVKLSKKHF